jgi:soluble lytic murein transglycosylase-like protein
MKKLYTVLVIALMIGFMIFLFEPKEIVYLSLPPENHPEVIEVEKMIDNTKVKVPDETKKKIALAIVSNGRFYDVKYKHLVAIAYVESGFRPDLINNTGDHGLMQVNWNWWGKKFVDAPSDLLNVYKNVEIACKIIKSNESNGFMNLASYHSFNPYRQHEYSEKLKSALRRL